MPEQSLGGADNKIIECLLCCFSDDFNHPRRNILIRLGTISFIRQSEFEVNWDGDQQGCSRSDDEGRFGADPFPKLRTEPGRRKGDEPEAAVKHA